MNELLPDASVLGLLAFGQTVAITFVVFAFAILQVTVEIIPEIGVVSSSLSESGFAGNGSLASSDWYLEHP